VIFGGLPFFWAWSLAPSTGLLVYALGDEVRSNLHCFLPSSCTLLATRLAHMSCGQCPRTYPASELGPWRCPLTISLCTIEKSPIGLTLLLALFLHVVGCFVSPYDAECGQSSSTHPASALHPWRWSLCRQYSVCRRGSVHLHCFLPSSWTLLAIIVSQLIT